MSETNDTFLDLRHGRRGRDYKHLLLTTEMMDAFETSIVCGLHMYLFGNGRKFISFAISFSCSRSSRIQNPARKQQIKQISQKQ